MKRKLTFTNEPRSKFPVHKFIFRENQRPKGIDIDTSKLPDLFKSNVVIYEQPKDKENLPK